MRAAGAQWLEADGDDELSLTVLIERRVLWGTPRDPLPLAEGEEHDRVVGALLRRALDYSPPTGFDADRVLELDGTRSDVLDIRRAAVIPIVELARWAGAAAGVIEGSTPDRLRGAGAAGVLDDGDAQTLVDAFELALELRIDHHMRQLARGRGARRPHPDRRNQPADPRLPARRVPRRDGRAAEAERVRLRAPRSDAAAAFAAAGRPDSKTPWREASWCAIDLELTGLDPDNDEIIAIGAMPIEQGRLILGESRYTLVRTARRSEHDAVLMHKLRVVDLADAPPLEQAVELLLELLSGRVPVFHTAAVERTFLAPLFSQLRVRLPGRRRHRDSRPPVLAAARRDRAASAVARDAAERARSVGRGAPPRARRRALHRAGVHRAREPPRRQAAADGRLAAARRQLAGERPPVRCGLEAP